MEAAAAVLRPLGRTPAFSQGQHGHFGFGTPWLEREACSPCLPAPGSLGLTSGNAVVIMSPSPSEPLSTCAFTPSSLWGQICHCGNLYFSFVF